MTEEAPSPRAPPPGGRLKFFKDGKFILELARAREGERVAWVSVPRKTFWPPPPGGAAAPAHAPPAAPTALTVLPRRERAPSLSVSDDNSSIQSSPWQRDHCWKQSAPQRGLSKELTGLYLRPLELPTTLLTMPSARRKRRRPFDTAPVTLPNGLGIHLSNGTSNHTSDNGSDETDSTQKIENPTPGEKKSVPTDKHIGIGKFKFFKHVCDTLKGHVVLKVYKKSGKSKKRRELCKIIETLSEKLPAQPLPANAKISTLNCKQEHMMVSPRKRILRELERVSLEDLANKRSRSRATTITPKAGPSHAQVDTASVTVAIPAPGHFNGTPSNISRREPPTSKPVSNYSIHSLLSMSEENSTRRSPETYTAKKSTQIYNYIPHKTDSPVSVHSPDLSSSPDGLEHRQSRSLRPLPYVPHSYNSPSHSGHSSASPRPPEKYFYPEPFASPEDTPPLTYQLYQPTPYMPSPTYLGSAYPTFNPRVHPHMWLQYPSLLPPGPWAPLPQPLLTDNLPREDTSSDLPLNLSKH